jgi:flavin-dependent dehydrogenase
VTEPDVLVVGGGPAGSASASFLAASGLRVLLVERKRFPRDKVCGEFLSGESLQVLGSLGLLDRLEEAGAAAMARVRISTPGGRVLEAPLPRPADGSVAALGVSRALLDSLLLERAEALGAEVRTETEAVSLERLQGSEGIRVGLRARGGDEESSRARAVVAADGRRGTVARLLGLRPRAARGRRAPYGVKVHLAGIGSRLADRVELHFARGGYLGLGPVEEGLVDAALLCDRARFRAAGAPDAVLASLTAENREAAARLEGARPAGPFRAIGPLDFGPLCAARKGVFFVGDAAGTVDPLAGEGIAQALRGGEMLARLLGAALAAAPCPGAPAERAWRRAWRRAFLRSMRRCRIIGRTAVRPALIEPAVALLGRRRGLAAGLVAATRIRARRKMRARMHG